MTEYAARFRAGPVSTRNIDSVRMKRPESSGRLGTVEEDLQKWKHMTQLMATNIDSMNREMRQLKEEKKNIERRM